MNADRVKVTAMAAVFIFAFTAFAVKSDAGENDFRGKFIVGMFSVFRIKNIQIIKQAKFNCTHTYDIAQPYLNEYIQEAKKNALLALIYPGIRYSDYGASNEKNVRELISDNKASNIIWFLADEPDLNKNSGARDRVIGLNAAVKSADPSAITAIIVSTPDKFRDYEGIADIFMFDVYPIGMPCKGKYGVKNVSLNTRLAVEAAGRKHPVWAVLQAFGYQNKKNKGWGWKREPTYEEERAMTYLAVINGAKGIFYFTFWGSQYRIEDSPKHWAGIKSIAAELNSLSPVILSPVDASITLDDGNKNKSIEFTARHYKNKTYLFAVNTEENPVKANITGAFNSYTAYGGDKVNFKNGRVDDVFKPLETKIYVFTAKGKV